MLQDRHIAFFIDVDNVGLQSENYFNIIDQLNDMGTILMGKVYGAGERKHKDIYADARLRGIVMERQMRKKRRGRKDFDARIYVDVVDAVNKTPAIDTVCIVAEPSDMVHLYGYLRGRGLKIVALDNTDEACMAFVDEIIDPGMLFELKFDDDATEKKPAAKVVTPVVEQHPTAEAVSTESEFDDMDELFKEIERLRQLATPTVEQPVEQSKASIVEETQSLLGKIADITAEKPTEQVEEQPAQPQANAPRTIFVPQNDGDLARKIDEIRKSNDGGDQDDLLEEIRKLLDGLE